MLFIHSHRSFPFLEQLIFPSPVHGPASPQNMQVFSFVNNVNIADRKPTRDEGQRNFMPFWGSTDFFQVALQTVHPLPDVFKGIGIGEAEVSLAVHTEVDTGGDTDMGSFEDIKCK